MACPIWRRLLAHFMRLLPSPVRLLTGIRNAIPTTISTNRPTSTIPPDDAVFHAVTLSNTPMTTSLDAPFRKEPFSEAVAELSTDASRVTTSLDRGATSEKVTRRAPPRKPRKAPRDRTIDGVLTYLHPPLLAWIFAPLTVFPEPVAYVLWTAISVAALVFAWHLAAPYQGLAKLTLLLVAIGLWPVMQAFYYGQPTFLVIALVAVAWWLSRRDQMLVAGIALALATALKPQVVFMIPICLLVAGRFKAVVGWAGACAVLAALSAGALGPAGLASYWEALRLGQADVGHTFFTVAYLFGLHLGPATYAVLAVQGIACLYVAWSRREDLDIVFAAGLLGTLMVSIHLHQPDYSNLVLAAWLVLRGTPSLAHRLWFGVGIVTMQVLTLGQPVPQLLWDAGWLTILGVGGIKPRRESLSHDRSAEPAAEPVV